MRWSQAEWKVSRSLLPRFFQAPVRCSRSSASAQVSALDCVWRTMEPEVKELLKQAKDLVASKNYEQLLINAKEIVRLDRKNYNGYVFYGLGAAHQNQRDVSEKAYRKAIELNPTQPTAHQVCALPPTFPHAHCFSRVWWNSSP